MKFYSDIKMRPRKRAAKKMRPIIAIILALFAIGVFAATFSKGVELDRNCTGFLKRASDANTVETAREELQKAIQYLEKNNLTYGYTSVIWKTPDEDIGFWYKNLKESESELMKVDSTTSSIEKTNLLMKLRETLLDGGEKGDVLTVPNGLHKYPNNGMWAYLQMMAIIALIVLFGSIEND